MRFVTSRTKLLNFSLICITILFVYVVVSNFQNPLLDEDETDALDDENVKDYLEVLGKYTGSHDNTALPILKNLLNCSKRDFSPKSYSHGKYWILKNFIKGKIRYKCHESITYTTHTDVTYLNNVIPLLKRWRGPLSIAVYAPGDDFNATLHSIFYMRNCVPSSDLVRKYATFHLFFEEEFSIAKVSTTDNLNLTCANTREYLNYPIEKTFKYQRKLPYPINVGRNLARNASLTHFILASDIELYPNPGFIKSFLTMMAKNGSEEYTKGKNVFVLPIFEIQKGLELPTNKLELRRFFNAKKVIWFHHKICPLCHLIPHAKEWMTAKFNVEMQVFEVAKRSEEFYHWEPLYVGTNDEPLYEERIFWEGKRDKMTQAYTMCLLDYNFNILSNGFLIHKPGIKSVKEGARYKEEFKNFKFIQEEILPEVAKIYGTSDNFAMDHPVVLLASLYIVNNIPKFLLILGIYMLLRFALIELYKVGLQVAEKSSDQ